MGHRVIAVTGIPGAWMNQVGKFLLEQDWVFTWPDQDLTCPGHRRACSNFEQPNLVIMHDILLGREDRTWFTASAPQYYDEVYPGPRELLAQFPENSKILLMDMRFCLFLPMWAGQLSNLIVCKFPLERSAEVLRQWTNNRNPLDRTRLVAHHYQQRLDEHSQEYPNRLELEHEEIKRGTFKDILKNWI